MAEHTIITMNGKLLDECMADAEGIYRNMLYTLLDIPEGEKPKIPFDAIDRIIQIGFKLFDARRQ